MFNKKRISRTSENSSSSYNLTSLNSCYANTVQKKPRETFWFSPPPPPKHENTNTEYSVCEVRYEDNGVV